MSHPVHSPSTPYRAPQVPISPPAELPRGSDLAPISGVSLHDLGARVAVHRATVGLVASENGVLLIYFFVALAGLCLGAGSFAYGGPDAVSVTILVISLLFVLGPIVIVVRETRQRVDVYENGFVYTWSGHRGRVAASKIREVAMVVIRRKSGESRALEVRLASGSVLSFTCLERADELRRLLTSLDSPLVHAPRAMQGWRPPAARMP